MPACRNCSYVGHNIFHGFCSDCWDQELIQEIIQLKNEIGNYQREENILGIQINQLKEQLEQAKANEREIEDQKQRILTLEADQTDLLHQLSETKQAHQTYLTQEKVQIHQEIQLIKEVLND